VDSVARRRKDRHRRLQYEAERHWTAWPIKNVPPVSAEILERDAVPRNAKDDEPDDQRHRDARLNDLASRRRVGQNAALCEGPSWGEVFSIFATRPG
jgi:hypothetical protein